MGSCGFRRVSRRWEEAELQVSEGLQGHMEPRIVLGTHGECDPRFLRFAANRGLLGQLESGNGPGPGPWGFPAPIPGQIGTGGTGIGVFPGLPGSAAAAAGGRRPGRLGRSGRPRSVPLSGSEAPSQLTEVTAAGPGIAAPCPSGCRVMSELVDSDFRVVSVSGSMWKIRLRSLGSPTPSRGHWQG